MYSVLDVTDWAVSVEFVSGSKEKEWRIEPGDGKYGLLKKPVTFSLEEWDPSCEYTGEAWSEKLAAEIGKELGIRTHEVEIALFDGVYCSLCWRFLNPRHATLEEGADLIMPFDPTYDRTRLRGEQVHYNLELLYQVFSKHDILPRLFEMIVFDALIGNTDRHQDNFGIITEHGSGAQSFAPLYDNASCLGRELTLEGVRQRLRDRQQFDAYINRATTLIRVGEQKRGAKHFALIEHILNSEYQQQLAQEIRRVEELTDAAVDRIVNQVDGAVMHADYKTFVRDVLRARRERLLVLGKEVAC